MPPRLINLLPEDRARALRRDYFLRLAVVATLLLALVIIIHGVLLLPSYLALSQMRDAETAQLARAGENLDSSGSGETDTELATLAGEASELSSLAKAPSASAAVRALLAVPRPGIRITSITFTPAASTAADGTMTVSGVAATREALRAYDLALSSLPSVTSADLPISVYAEEADISFTITLSGTPTS